MAFERFEEFLAFEPDEDVVAYMSFGDDGNFVHGGGVDFFVFYAYAIEPVFESPAVGAVESSVNDGFHNIYYITEWR